MSRSLYGFVKSREPVSAEEVARDYLALAGANGDARKLVERVIPPDSGLWWENGYLRTTDPAALSLHDTPYVVFDVETTGSSAKEGGITELGAVKVWRGEVVEELSTLVNPGLPIQPFVVKLTGITDEMVAEAPTPEEVMPRFEEFAEGCVLVGHNVAFDQGFVDAARESFGMSPLQNPILDTLKLARVLVPGLKRYRLSSLVEHFEIEASPNHRALADAEATAGVLDKLLKLLDSQGIKSAGEAATLRRTSKKRPKPQNSKKQHLAEGVPETPGVYYFVDGDGTTLYVGKAKNLKNRVRTYFAGGDGRRKIGRLVRETVEVRYEETESELYALILEAREIRRLLPRFNAVGRGEEKSWFVRLSLEEPYPVPERVAADDGTSGEAIFVGPYRSAGMLGVCLEALGRIFPLRRCSGRGVARNGPCFYGQMGRCAPCMGMSEEEYRRTVVDGIATLLRGEGGEEHLRALVAERERLAGELEFEAAARLRDLISGIERARLARAIVSAGGPQAVVAPSTEPGVIEVFVISGGRLIAHRGFEEGDEAVLSEFASESLAGRGGITGESAGADEARVVSSYLRRSRSATVVEALALDSPDDLLRSVRKVREASGGSGDVGVEDAEDETDEAT